MHPAGSERPEHIQTPGPGQESVWDYPRPPRVERVDRVLRVEFGGLTLAETRDALRVSETASPPTFYIPAGDVRRQYLQHSGRTTVCEWKGVATYWSVRVGNRLAEDAAWNYPDPKPDYAMLRDHLAFFAGKMDACFVDDTQVTPQPGSYYGGWITPDIVGPFKGGPGTEGW